MLSILRPFRLILHSEYNYVFEQGNWNDTYGMHIPLKVISSDGLEARVKPTCHWQKDLRANRQNPVLFGGKGRRISR